MKMMKWDLILSQTAFTAWRYSHMISKKFILHKKVTHDLSFIEIYSWNSFTFIALNSIRSWQFGFFAENLSWKDKEHTDFQCFYCANFSNRTHLLHLKS